MEQAAAQFGGFGVDLTGDEENRNRISVRDCQPRCGVGDAGPAGYATHAYPSRRPSIAICHQSSRFLVPHKDMLDLRVPVKRVVECECMCARHAEDDLNAVLDETLHEKLGAGHWVNDPPLVEFPSYAAFVIIRTGSP